MDGHVVWVNGPFAPGPNTDVVIFCTDMKLHFLDGEYVIADKGYRDNKCITPDRLTAHGRRLAAATKLSTGAFNSVAHSVDASAIIIRSTFSCFMLWRILPN